MGGTVIKVLTVGNSTPALKKIHNQLSPLKDDSDLSFEMAKPGSIASALRDGVNILIYDAGDMKPLMTILIQEIRKMGFSGPIVILATVPQGMDVSEFHKLKNLHIVEKPYVQMQILGVVRNCISNSDAKTRRFKRFDVKENAVIETYSSDFRLETTINNISQNGVRIEGDLAGLNKGDLLRLHFNFDKIKKERVMSARVVWKKVDGDNKEEAGLEFVSQKTVYKYLLDHAIS